MKKLFFTAVFLAVLGTLAVSCLKENPVEPSGTGVQDETVYNVCYSVDGVTMRDTLYGQAEWNTFLHRLVALAKEGHEVSFRDGNAAGSAVAPKETVTFVSKNEEEVVRWSTTMFDDGYEVTIVYNEETDEFTCIAVRDTLAPQPEEPTYDTLPNSEWWESRWCSNTRTNVITCILLNISWQDSLLRSYTTNYSETPRCFFNDSIIPFEMVDDTLFYHGIHNGGFVVTHTSDTTMTWATFPGVITPSKSSLRPFFYFNKL